MTRSILEYVILTGSLHSRTKTLGQVAASLRILSLPRGHKVQPSASCWGSPGATPGRGCVRFPHVQANYEFITAAVDARLRGCAALHVCTHTCTSPLPTHNARSIIITQTMICACPLGAQAAFDRCHFCVGHFRVVFMYPYKSAHTALSWSMVPRHVIVA